MKYTHNHSHANTSLNSNPMLVTLNYCYRK